MTLEILKTVGTHPMKKLILVFSTTMVLVFGNSPSNAAQAPDTLVSPEVLSDHRVTFRVRAPKASEVALIGDWMKTGAQEKMSKDAEGVWSVTIGPMAPSIYIYTVSIDGVVIPDPINPRVKLRARTSASLLEVSADSPQVWQARDVPHGTVEIVVQKSTVISGETRQIWV